MDSRKQPSHPPTSWKRRILWSTLALLVGLGLLDGWYQFRREHRYDAEILRAAEQHKIEPALVKAVVWRESKFDPKVRGKAGEIGLMQIRSLAAHEFAQATAGRRTFEGNLFEPQTNLQVGSWYLSKLIKRYARTDNPVAYALADYNAGRSNVLRWNKGTAATNSEAFLAQITFPSTQSYVRTIVRRRAKYQGQFQPPRS